MADISKIRVPIDGVMTDLNIKGSGGSGLPNEVITYEQFQAKTDEQKAAYTGYIQNWPGSGGGGGGDTTIRYNEETDWVQVMINNTWTNCYYAGMKLDPTKMELTQDEFVAICNQGLQSNMSVGAIISLNNQYCSQYEVIDVEHDGISNSVDIMAHTQVNKITFDDSSRTYRDSQIRDWINSTYLNAFDNTIQNLAKNMTVLTYGDTTTDKVKILSWKEIGVTYNSTYVFDTDGGIQYPVFTSGAYPTAILDRWRNSGNYGSSVAYWLRSASTGGSSRLIIVKSDGTCSNDPYNGTLGILPVMRF